MGNELPEPQGQQREVVYLRGKGHCVALGVAGSGKTVMAVRRARYLATVPGLGGPTLLITFNGALVTYLKSLVDKESGVTVEQYHLFARRILQEHFGRSPRICDSSTRNGLIARALKDVRLGAAERSAAFRKPVRFFADEFDWLNGNGIGDFDEYLSGELDRVGRGSNLLKADRLVVYKVYRRYQVLLSNAGFDLDWSSLASELLRTLNSEVALHGYRHVVVDEGQDFTPEMIRSLAALIPEDGSLTFFGDYAQQIYGSRMSWKSLGLKVTGGRLVRFDRNYRNTRQIAQLAKAISDYPKFGDGIELVEPTTPVRSGKLPLLTDADSDIRLIEAAAHFATNLCIDRNTQEKDQRVAVLSRDEALTERIARLVKRQRTLRLHKGMTKWDQSPGVYYGPYSEARGLEFDTVVLPFRAEDEMPPEANIEAFGLEEAKVRQARELYVAVTRARTDVVLIHHGRLTSVLPVAESGIYELLSS
ncbi:UvrD-helicase domain-containing protein [Amycolatopsis azurea]|uniref:UvrD-helicase domain-containing protein n=1 Tax=Amycolatopsis azurea TaxID=36819 RepID=UPI00380CD9DB